MFAYEILPLKGKTSYFQSSANVGIYEISNDEVILIDACEHIRVVRNLDKQLTERGLKVNTIIDTHCHVDHICGNAYFKEKYNAKLLSTDKEKMFIKYPTLEPEFYYAGIDTNKKLNPFFLTEPSEPEVITDNNIPEGFEIIPLPGHSFEMIGVRTPDNVVFLADSVLSKKTWDEYKLPFFHDVNTAIETLEAIREMKADLFVPSHNEPLENITELADYNIEKMQKAKKLVLEICEGLSFEEIFVSLMKRLDITVLTQKYPMYSLMLRNLLKALVDDNKIGAKMVDEKFLYYRK